MGILGRKTKWGALEKRSMMVKIGVLPDNGGKLVMKSSAMWDHGRPGTGRGQNNLAGGELGDFFLAH